MTLFRRLLVAVACGALFTPGSASAGQTTVVYDCQFQKASANGDWVPTMVALAHVPGEATAQEGDPVSQSVTGGPVVAKVETDNARRITFTWSLTAKNSRNQNATMAYRLTVMKADLSATISARPLGYANDFASRGRCKRLKG